MLKVAHISDLHLSRKFKPGNLDGTMRLIDHALSLGVDHLVITGDLTHNVSGDDLPDLRGILDRFGILDTRKTSLVIGIMTFSVEYIWPRMFWVFQVNVQILIIISESVISDMFFTTCLRIFTPL
jgi:3',5'-cyclic AMP phosphodiesterase CpdA